MLLLVLGLVQFTNIVDFMIMMPLGPMLMAQFHITPKEFAAVVSAYTISAGTSGFISAFFMDRYDRKQVLQVVFLGFVLGTLACGLAPSYALLLAARILTGLFGGLLGGQVMAIISDAFPIERRGSAMGIAMMAFSVGSVVGVPLGLYLAGHQSWHVPFISLAGLGAVVWGMILAFVPKINAHLDPTITRKRFEFLTQIFQNREQQKALLLMATMMFGQFVIVPFLASFYIFNLGFTHDNLPYMYICGGLASVVVGPLVGRLADRFGKRKLFMVFSVAMIVPLLIISNLHDVPVWVAIICSTLFFITVSGRGIPAMTIITGTVKPAQRGSFMSINTSVQHAGSGLASMLAGLVIAQSGGPTSPLENFPLVGMLAAGFALLSLAIGASIKFQERETPPIVTANTPSQVTAPQLD